VLKFVPLWLAGGVPLRSATALRSADFRAGLRRAAIVERELSDICERVVEVATNPGPVAGGSPVELPSVFTTLAMVLRGTVPVRPGEPVWASSDARTNVCMPESYVTRVTAAICCSEVIVPSDGA
jgi:hypothetical protein